MTNTAYNNTVLADSPYIYMQLDGLTNGGSGSYTAFTATRSSYNTWTTGIGGGGGANGASVFDQNNNSYIRYSGGVNDMFNGGTWSVELWFKKANTTDANGYRELFNTYDSGNANQVAIYGNDNTGKVSLWYSFKGGARTKLDGPVINDTNWHHVVGTSDGTTVRFYVDGVQVATTGTASTGTMPTATAFWLGAYGTAQNNENWHGAIDELAIYKGTALSLDRVQAHYTAGGGVIPNVTVSVPPVAMGTLATVTPAVSVISPNVTNVVSPFNLGPLSDPTPVVYGGSDITVAAPPMALSLATVAPTVSIGTQTSVATQNYGFDNGSSGKFGLEQFSSSGWKNHIFFGGFTTPTAPTTGYSLQSAILNLNAEQAGGYTSQAIYVELITSSWSETTISQTGDPTTTLSNRVAFTLSVGQNQIDVTPLVNKWVNGTQTNYGLAVYSNDPGGAQIYVDSRQNATTANRPTLQSTFAPTPPTVVSPAPITLNLTEVAPVVIAQTNVSSTAVAIDLGTLGTVAPADTTDQVLSVPRMVMNLVTVVPTLSTDHVLSVPPASATLSAVNPTVATTTGVVARPDPMTLSLDILTPDIYSGTDLINAAPPVELTLSFVGGATHNPDYYAIAVPINAGTVSAPVASVGLEYPIYVNADPIGLTLEQEDNAAIDLTTNVIARVANAMTANIKMVGIYNEADDRYLQTIPTTVDADDIWYRLNDGAGATRASDSVSSITGTTTTWKQDGSYFGSPSFLQSDGPELRPAYHFNGTTDYLIAGPYSITDKIEAYEASTVPQNDIYSTMSVTIEFSIRTTSDGIVFVGTGGQDSTLAGTSPTASDSAILNGNELRIEGGMLVFYNASGKSVKVRRPIADGQWHHVVIGIPSQAESMTGGKYDNEKASYVVIDGTPALVRYVTFLGDSKSWGGYWLPYSFMARATPNYTNAGDVIASKTVSGFLNGDLSNVIIRLNSYLPVLETESIYYDWSLATVLDADPITVNLSTVNPFKVKGNTKTMLAIYGLPWLTDQNGHQLFNYMSNLSGMVIHNLTSLGVAGWAHPGTTSLGSPVWYKPQPFMLDGYMVYPISITGDSYASATSVDGVLNPDATTSYTGNLVDDATGLPRFLNLQDDLLDDVTNFDVVTVVNYPWERPHDAIQYHGKEIQGAQPIQQSLGLSDEEWTQTRDAFRDSLLQAVYDGVNLWVGEYYMAFHLGFIQGYDIHDPGYFESSVRSTSTNPAMFGRMLAHNRHAMALESANIVGNHGAKSVIDAGTGDFFTYPQVNFSRRIVALEDDLTDVPSYEFGDFIEGWNVDEYLPGGSFIAYNVVDRSNGLQVGDLVKMSMLPYQSKFTGGLSQQTTGYQNDRMAVISAHPDGIAGKVIAREQDFYYGSEGVVVDNPFKNNVTTIAAERGTVVRGRAIAGRVFIEFMDTDVDGAYIPVQTDQNAWMGDHLPSPVSLWDYDTRRDKEIKTSIIVNNMKFNATTGQFDSIQSEIRYFSYTSEGNTYYRRESMHTRGLNWLANAPEINAGDVTVYGEAIVVNLTAPAPKFDYTANPTVKVVGLADLYLEARRPSNFQDGNVVEYAQPMSIDLKVNGLGVLVQPQPVSLSVALVNPTIQAATDTVTVYLDGDRNITLFLKEDN